ncbi:MAG: hypothetical protein HY842_05585 [Bacteroidetes bacterium]|nr:hypothetical protein [Bacteroidota bacterium]
MNENPKVKIDQILAQGIDFKFGDYIGQGFSLLQKNLGGFIGFTLVFIILSAVISLIPIVGTIANSLFISPALTVGFYLVARKLDRNEGTEFGDFFKGFDFIGQFALTAVVTGLILLVSMIPFIISVWGTGLFDWYQEAMQNPAAASDPPSIPFWSIILLAPAIFLGLAYSWSYLFVAFHGMSFWDAMEASRRILMKIWPVYFAFTIVVGLIMAAGIILLCVGLLASLPAGYCMVYAAFADVTKLNVEPDPGDEIEQHLVE